MHMSNSLPINIKWKRQFLSKRLNIKSKQSPSKLLKISLKFNTKMK